MTADTRPAPATLQPGGPELAARNRRIMAGRYGWPAGTIEACQRFDATWPAWSTMWRDGDRPGFYSIRIGHRQGEPAAYGATPGDLAEVIESWPWRPRDWTYRPLPRFPRDGGR